MTITHNLTLDLQRKGELQRIDVVQGDAFTRQVNLALLCGGKPWNIPICTPVVRYSKPDGTEGIYETLPDGMPGVTYSGNTLTLELAPQMLTCAGPVQVQVELNLEDRRLATFTFMLVVEPGVALAGKSEDYVNWTKAYLPQTTGAKVGQYVRVAEVDGSGRIIRVVSADTPDDAMQTALDAKDAAENAGSKAGQAVALATQANNTAEAALEKANAALPAASLPDAVNDALAEAKESGAFDGKDGASVTVASISESAEDGGSNVVTLSDGKTITIKNGNKGSNGLAILAVNLTAGNAQKIVVSADNVIENGYMLSPRDILIGDKVLTEDGKIYIVDSWNFSVDTSGGSNMTYNATFFADAGSGIKSVNGVIPDENGNVEITGMLHTAEIPEYWKEHLDGKIAEIKALQNLGGKDCVSFVWASDPHVPDNNGGRTNDIGKVMAYVMDACDIPFAVLSGDIYSQGSAASKEELEAKMSEVPVHLAPLWGTERLLSITGNHDGCYGTEYYRKQLPPAEMWSKYFRGQATDFRRVFSDDGSYYYVDNPAQKTRFIMLNSNWHGAYSVDEHGLAVPDRFNTSCYGQAQLDWLKDVALDMEDDRWGAVIVTHVPPITADYAVDYIPFRGIIDDFANKTTSTWSYADGVDGWSNCSVTTDFTSAKGQIIAVLSGHIHQDNYFEDITWSHVTKTPLITVTTAGGDVRDKNPPSRTHNTASETAFDVVTVNRKTETIYCTRIGAGSNRTFGGLSYTNYADSTSADWATDSRISSSGSLKNDASGFVVTNYIPVAKGQTIHIKNAQLVTGYNQGHYDSAKALVAHSSSATLISNGQVIAADYDSSVTLYQNVGQYGSDSGTYAAWADTMAFVRLTIQPTGAHGDVIITVDENISDE